MFKFRVITLASVALVAASGADAQEAMDFDPSTNLVSKMEIKSDYLAASKVTHEIVATGNVSAVAGNVRFRGSKIHMSPEGKADIGSPAEITTCSNDWDHLHWKLRGDFEYQDRKYISGTDSTLYMFGKPAMWFPYVFYPMNTDYGWRFLPGYTSRWGAYLLTGYVYDIYGESLNSPYSLGGSSYMDFRTENGIAVGQTFRWHLGKLGHGKIKGYYAWDSDHDRYDGNEWNSHHQRYESYGADIDRGRYALMLQHFADFTERDSFRFRSSYLSDAMVYSDFLRNNQRTIDALSVNEATYEHRENNYDVGVTVAGPVNSFYSGVARLPEVWFDVNPQPLFSMPLDYESQTHIGFLNRQFGRLDTPVEHYRYLPGEFADYQATRIDSLHRVSLPFKLWDDILSFVPRASYRATWYSDSGIVEPGEFPDGGRTSASGKSVYRGIYEAGFTVSARGTKWLSQEWRHMIEPYLDYSYQDVHTQYEGSKRNNRIFMFDDCDRAYRWLDQFGFDGRGLPYAWHGIRPGIRNIFQRRKDSGALSTVLETDVYAAIQFNDNGKVLPGKRRSLDQDDPNLDSGTVVPGFMVRYHPDDDMSLRMRMEFDTEDDRLAYSDITFTHRINRDFRWYLSYVADDYRLWDYADNEYFDRWNNYRLGMGEVGFTHDVCDAFAWSPYLIWDLRCNDLEEIGTWFELRTDCLAFRFTTSFENSYTRSDGYKRGCDWRFGFFVYLRAFGSQSVDQFSRF